jgi:hypothetical protein
MFRALVAHYARFHVPMAPTVLAGGLYQPLNLPLGEVGEPHFPNRTPTTDLLPKFLILFILRRACPL